MSLIVLQIKFPLCITPVKDRGAHFFVFFNMSTQPTISANTSDFIDNEGASVQFY